MSCRHKDEINCSIMYGTWKKLYPTTWIDCSKCFDCTCLLCIKSATLADFHIHHLLAAFRVRIETLPLLPGMGCLEGWGRWVRGAGGHGRHSPLGILEWSQVFKAMGSWQFCGILLELIIPGEEGESLGMEFLWPYLACGFCPQFQHKVKDSCRERLCVGPMGGERTTGSRI